MYKLFKKRKGTLGQEFCSARVVEVVAIVANWDTTQFLIKTTGDLSQPGNSPLCNSIVFAIIPDLYLPLQLPPLID